MNESDTKTTASVAAAQIMSISITTDPDRMDGIIGATDIKGLAAVLGNQEGSSI